MRAPALIALLAVAAPLAAQSVADSSPFRALTLPETETIETDLATIYVLHDVHALDLDPGAAGFHVIVSGHSHKPARTERDGVLFINPGSAGPRRFDLPVTVALLRLGTTPWDIEFVDLLGKDKETLPADCRTRNVK